MREKLYSIEEVKESEKWLTKLQVWIQARMII